LTPCKYSGFAALKTVLNSLSANRSMVVLNGMRAS